MVPKEKVSWPPTLFSPPPPPHLSLPLSYAYSSWPSPKQTGPRCLPPTPNLTPPCDMLRGPPPSAKLKNDSNADSPISHEFLALYANLHMAYNR